MNLCIAFITLVFSFFAASADAAPAPVKKEPQSSKFGPFEPPPERNFPYGDGDKPYTINTVQSEDVKKDTAASEGTKDVEKKYPGMISLASASSFESKANNFDGHSTRRHLQ
ncbi:hypothetical protein FB446DRAFT_792826 [Lentinula raphanica]|nr:hypothetical protein FB446DRAFT_792826 [Lentinula raphanica]